VYRVEFTLREDSIACGLFDGEGTSLASTTVDHPDGFAYDPIDQVVIVSREPVDIYFDDISVPTG